MNSRTYRRVTFLSAALIAAIGIPGVANASAYQCKCMPGMADNIAYVNTDKNKYTCVDYWESNNTGHDTGGYNNNVKFSFPDAVVNSDHTNVKFAARNLPDQCMNYAGQYIYDGGGTYQLWAGGKCDDSNLNVNGWKFDETKSHFLTGFKMTQITGEMRTTSAHNHFAAFYNDKSDGKHLIGVCAD